jgi:hypothetical protein
MNHYIPRQSACRAVLIRAVDPFLKKYSLMVFVNEQGNGACVM